MFDQLLWKQKLIDQTSFDQNFMIFFWICFELKIIVLVIKQGVDQVFFQTSFDQTCFDQQFV